MHQLAYFYAEGLSIRSSSCLRAEIASALRDHTRTNNVSRDRRPHFAKLFLLTTHHGSHLYPDCIIALKSGPSPRSATTSAATAARPGSAPHSRGSRRSSAASRVSILEFDGRDASRAYLQLQERELIALSSVRVITVTLFLQAMTKPTHPTRSSTRSTTASATKACCAWRTSRRLRSCVCTAFTVSARYITADRWLISPYFATMKPFTQLML